MARRHRQIRFNSRARTIACCLLSAALLPARAALAEEATPLTAAVISGSTVYAQVDFFAAYRGQLGQHADAEAARAVMSGIESMYLRDGYVKPRIQVRDDLLADGILRVDIHEIRLAEVVVQGEAGPYAGRIDASRQALLAQAPLQTRSIPDALGALRALPGLTVEAGIGEQPGDSGGVVLNLTTRYKPVAAIAQWSNRGTDEVGPNFYSVQLTGNGLLRANERIGAYYTTAAPASEYHAVGGFIEVPLGRRGPLLALSAFHSNAQPTLDGTQYDLFYPQDTFVVALSRQFVHGTRLGFSAGLGAEYSNSYIDYEGERIESDRLRSAQLNLRLDGKLGNTAYALSASWRHGLDAFGSGITFIDGSTLDPEYDAATFELVFAAPFARHWRWRVETQGQWGSQTLPYVERFKVGGVRLGRGLSTAVMAGDSGVGAKAELGFVVGGLPRWMGKLTLFGYSDYGTVWERGVSGRQYVGTSGAGFVADHVRYRLSVEVGRPVTYSGSRPGGTSVFGEVQIRF